MRRATEINRSQFEAMGRVKQDLLHYQEEHEGLVGSEMAVIQEESLVKDHYRKATPSYSCYEEELGDVNGYLNSMEEGIRRKLEIVMQMQANLERMRGSVQNASALTLKMREEQEEHTLRHPHFNEHSSSNLCRNQGRVPLPFNGFTNFQQHHHNDEQLLEGLPGDDSMSRLF